jgi:hypothetical protein
MTSAPHGCRYEEAGFAAAYALDLLDGAELGEYEAHLAGCPVCPDEVAAYAVAATALAPDAAEAAVASSLGLRDRILAAAVAEREAAGAVVVPLPVASAREGADGARSPDGASAASPPTPLVPPRSPWFVSFSIAAALAVLIGVGLLLRAGGFGPGAATSTPAPRIFVLGSGGAASGEAVFLPGEQQLRVTMRNLPPLAPDQVYQLWLLRAGRVESAQVFRLQDGAGSIVT